MRRAAQDLHLHPRVRPARCVPSGCMGPCPPAACLRIGILCMPPTSCPCQTLGPTFPRDITTRALAHASPWIAHGSTPAHRWQRVRVSAAARGVGGPGAPAARARLRWVAGSPKSGSSADATAHADFKALCFKMPHAQLTQPTQQQTNQQTNYLPNRLTNRRRGGGRPRVHPAGA